MSEEQVEHPKRRTLPSVLLFLIIAGVILGIYLPLGRDSFPDLPAGAYVGEITGLAADDTAPAALYVERLPNSPVFIVVSFIEGFRPQAVSSASDPKAVADGADLILQPLPVQFGKRNLLFKGNGRKESYSGTVAEGRETVGRWTLRPVVGDELNPSGKPPVDNETFRSWLATKAQYKALKRELHDLEVSNTTENERRTKLRTFVSDENLLRKRAAERRDELAADLQKALEKRKGVAKVVGDLVGELELLGRITRTGQVVNLARRVAHRENQWYQANWQQDEAQIASEETLPDGSAIDFQKLESRVKQANEVQALLRDLNTERERYRQLENGLNAPIQPDGGPSEIQNDSHPRQQQDQLGPSDRSLWERIFN